MSQNQLKAPLFRDPIFDGASDPVVIWNREEHAWWLIYTSRRASAEGSGVAWVHGSGLGVAASTDGGASWVYRGLLQGLDFEWGHNTFWAPEIIWHEGQYHMYVSYIQGIPDKWAGNKRRIVHYTSPNLRDWRFEAILPLSTEFVIDACVFPLPDGGFRMWYKDEGNQSHTYAADSSDLYQWECIGPVLTHRAHEGANVFALQGSYWMIVDEWRGQQVFRSEDLSRWEAQGLLLDQPGTRTDDGSIGHHADVVVQGDQAHIFYFTHPGRALAAADDGSFAFRRTSVQAAQLYVSDGRLCCNRDQADLPGLGTQPAPDAFV